MANRMELPDELRALIEKREQVERRANPADKPAANSDAGEAPAGAERRSGADRRREE